MVRVRWPSEEESTVIPAPGALTVLASSGDQAPPMERPERAAQAATKTTATAKKGASKKGGQQEDHGCHVVVALIRGCQAGGPRTTLRRWAIASSCRSTS